MVAPRSPAPLGPAVWAAAFNVSGPRPCPPPPLPIPWPSLLGRVVPYRASSSVLLVSYTVITYQYPHHNQSPHFKYIMRCCIHIHIPHLCFLQFILFFIGGVPILPNQHQGK